LDKERGDRPITLSKGCGAKRRRSSSHQIFQRSHASAACDATQAMCLPQASRRLCGGGKRFFCWLASCMAAVASLRSVPGTEGGRDLLQHAGSWLLLSVSCFSPISKIGLTYCRYTSRHPASTLVASPENKESAPSSSYLLTTTRTPVAHDVAHREV
jgi:hypothetical protein